MGGVLTDLASWRWVFFVNVPVGIITIALALRYVAESRVEVEHRSFDLAGAVTVTSGLVVLVYAIVKAQSYGWGSARDDRAACRRGGAAGGLRRDRGAAARRPLMRLSIFRVRALAVADSVLLLVASGMFGMFFFASLYVQEILGYSPLRAGSGLPAGDGRDHDRRRTSPSS